MYQELLEKAEKAEQELAEFDEKYPVLHIDYIFPKELVVSKLAEYAQNTYRQYLDETAYLEYEELADMHGISFGSFCHKASEFEVNRTKEQLVKEQERFVTELDSLCSKYKAEMLALALKISGSTAVSTARLIDCRVTLEMDLNKARKQLDKYYVKQCTRFSASRDLPIDVYYNTSKVPDEAGIYFLFLEGELVYIGRSTNLRKRLSNHELVRKYYLKSDENGYNVVCGVYQASDGIDELETTLIHVANPKYNIQSKDV